jgi:hypothetical protein
MDCGNAIERKNAFALARNGKLTACRLLAMALKLSPVRNVCGLSGVAAHHLRAREIFRRR